MGFNWEIIEHLWTLDEQTPRLCNCGGAFEVVSYYYYLDLVGEYPPKIMNQRLLFRGWHYYAYRPALKRGNWTSAIYMYIYI